MDKLCVRCGKPSIEEFCSECEGKKNFDFCRAIKCEFLNETERNKCRNEYGLEPFDCEQDASEEDYEKYSKYLQAKSQGDTR